MLEIPSKKNLDVILINTFQNILSKIVLQTIFLILALYIGDSSTMGKILIKNLRLAGPNSVRYVIKASMQ